ncbi:MAG: hypothetical protein P8J86_05025 [Phycisphaerales bacterium]|jgi:phage shock protein A|nr:hypothetical protein [Phycisphaerales bacterium]
MVSMTRFIFRWGLITGVVTGATVLIVGPERVWGGLAQIKAKAQSVVDYYIDDPIALRHQLQNLASEYPDRIADVQGELATVEHQLLEIQRDIDIADQVVGLTTTDLSDLRDLVARAEAEQTRAVTPVAIRYEGSRFNLSQAYTEARRIQSVKNTYDDRRAQDRQQLKFLEQQQQQLINIMAQLETEYATFQTKLWQIDRQINTIERNDRLIELTEQQQATLASYDRLGNVNNLKQIEGRLAELRAVQEATLRTLAKKDVNKDYEARAAMGLTVNIDKGSPFESLDSPHQDFESTPAVWASEPSPLTWADEIVID